MSSGGGKTTTTTNDPPKWAIDYFKGNLDQASQYANEPYQPYTGQRVVGVDTMNPYTSNRYANQQVQQLTGDITNAYKNGVQPGLMAQFRSGGAFGGTAHQQALAGAQGQFAHQLAEASTGIRAQNADAQREEWNRMLGRDQMYLDRNYEGYLDKRNYGKDRIGVMSDALRAITGGSSTGANPNYTSASQNAATWAAIIASMYNS